EPPREVRAQGRVGGRRLARLVDPDVEDAGRRGERRRRLEDWANVGNVGRAAHPPRAVAELLRELGRLAGAFDAERAVARPDADLPDVHLVGPYTESAGRTAMRRTIVVPMPCEGSSPWGRAAHIATARPSGRKMARRYGPRCSGP